MSACRGERAGGRPGRWARVGLVVGLVLGGGAAVRADDAPPPRRTVYQITDNRLVTPGPVVFETGSEKLKPESEAALEHVKGYLTEKAYITRLRIEGHSDAQGDASKAQALTELRAVAVARALIAKGIDCKRLIAVGFGDSKPIADSRTPEGRAQNRRVAFVNAELRGRAIGGMPVDGGGKVAAPDLCATK